MTFRTILNANVWPIRSSVSRDETFQVQRSPTLPSKLAAKLTPNIGAKMTAIHFVLELFCSRILDYGQLLIFRIQPMTIGLNFY